MKTPITLDLGIITTPYRNNAQNSDRQNHNYRSSTPKHQRQLKQVQTTSESTPDPP